MPNRIVAALMASCLAAVCAPALADPASPPAKSASVTVAPVTVYGAAPPKVIRKATEGFVQSHSKPTARIGQFARWRDPICVLVLGLTPDQAARVKDRTEEVAKEVGVKIGRPRCTPNVEIAFVNQPQALLDGLVAHSQDSIFGYHERHQLKALTTMSRPIQAWYKTATRGEGLNDSAVTFANYATGSPAAGGPAVKPAARGILPGFQPGGGRETVDSPASDIPMACGDSRFFSCLQSVFLNVFVVVDAAAVKGRNLGPVSDYLAMLALSQPRSLDGCEELASVMDLFAKSPCAGRDAPDGLTPADAAFLTALYKADLDSRGQLAQGDITNWMAGILIKANAVSGQGPAQTGSDRSTAAPAAGR